MFFLKFVYLQKNTQLMEKKKIIDWCIDCFCLCSVAVIFLYILSGWNDGIDYGILYFYMPRALVNTLVGLFILICSFIYCHIKKKPRRLIFLTSVINGVIAFLATYLYTFRGADGYESYSFFYKGHLKNYFVILFIFFMIVQYQLRNKEQQ